MSFFQSPANILLPLLVALIVLAALFGLVGVLWATQRSRLPAATRYIDIQEKLMLARADLAERQEKLFDLDRQISERAQLAGDVSALIEQRATLQAELAALDSARREIDEVRSQATAAAAEYAEVLGRLDDARDETEKLRSEEEKARATLLQAEQQTAIAADRIAQLSTERSSLEAALPALRSERDQAFRSIEEARQAKADQAALEVRTADLQGALVTLRQEVADLTTRTESLSRDRTEVERLRERAQELAGTIGKDEARLASLEAAIEMARKDLTEVRLKLAGTASGSDPEVDKASLIGDLARMPECLSAPAMLQSILRPEDQALGDVATYLKDHGLKYHPRTVFAFHTALKINDKAQMTVLAGVSGTGKSLLPRRYAEAMGIHFLQIAVEPRWDSPQDLLGFYNYIEKKYRATDLARLMVHMDPYHISHLLSQEEGNLRNHMSMVLLDEMNLARVEYYFSEFLSRLEARPLYEMANDPARRRDASITMDIRGLDQPITLFPSHNVLFAGTMNDDESTQALSDKVLDRSNVLQFAAPRTFGQAMVASRPAPQTKAQPFSQWRSWIKVEDGLSQPDRDRAARTVESLAEIMQKFGRPFGHRLRDSILAYVANYPRTGPAGADIAAPLVDQIELRIFPKVRGVAIDGHTEAFEDLSKLLRDLGDSDMATHLEALVEQQSQTSGMFLWRGFARS